MRSSTDNKVRNEELNSSLDIDSILSGGGSSTTRRNTSGTKKKSSSSKSKKNSSSKEKKISGSKKSTGSRRSTSSKKSSSTKKKNTSPKKDVKKSKRKKYENALDAPSTGRIVWSVFVGIFFVSLLSLVCYVGYMKYIKYPAEKPVEESLTGRYCLKNWTTDVHSLNGKKDGYLNQELTYANDVDYKEEFLKKVASTVKYTPKKVNGVNVYGNKWINSKTDKVIKVDSTVKVDEKVDFTYIDWNSLDFDKDTLKSIMTELNVKLGCTDYPTRLEEVFCKYVNGLEELPVKTVEYAPKMKENDDGTYSMLVDEDIFIDRLLFSSKSFFSALDRFSVVAGGINAVNPEYTAWKKLSDEEKAGKEQPKKWLSELQPTDEWKEWNNLSDEDKKSKKEPTKYNWKGMIRKDWCGAYYLQNEYVEYDSKGNPVKTTVKAQIGDGTFENPAGLNTEVLTYVFVSEKDKDGNMKDNKYPIKIKLTEYGVSEDAITWFEGKDEQNRGIDVNSEVQYVYYIFEVTNMSNKKLTINDNSTLCDKNANITSRTGILYGIKDSITLEPDESGTIESWSRSTELNKQYLVWGKDFERRLSPIWFRVLAGDIDNPDESKGVTLNTTRTGVSPTPTPYELDELKLDEN